MMLSENQRVVAKNFHAEKDAEWIRFSNEFVADFLFEDNKMVDIPITALRIIANVISIIRDHQFQPENRPQQLSLFEDVFETENNVFGYFSIKNSKVSPSRSQKQIVNAYEFLAKYKMGWYSSVNSKGKIIKTFGGLISLPSYENRGSTSFLISSFWLKKLIVIPSYNRVLFNLVYHVKNNKHVLFAIWLETVPKITGTKAYLQNLNKRFGLNYTHTGDFCSKFLRPLKAVLDEVNDLSFKYSFEGTKISVIPYLQEKTKASILGDSYNVKGATYRLNYFRKRFTLSDNDFIKLKSAYQHSTHLIENSYSNFVKVKRIAKIPTTFYMGKDFLKELQYFIIKNYRETKAANLLPEGYPRIL